jgi:NAD+ kinase
LKFGVFVHPDRPKVPLPKVRDLIKSAGYSYSQDEPEIGVVVGGDGTFGYYGRTLSIPLLFVGVRDAGILGSKAKLAETYYDELLKSLRMIEDGRYRALEWKMLSVRLNDRSADILTDVYLERGQFAGCLRYETTVSPYQSKVVRHSDYAIGNGIVVSTSFGARGYFSYPDRLQTLKKVKLRANPFTDNRVGICHIIPTFLAKMRRGKLTKSRSVRYTVPYGSKIEIRLLRDASARLYGTTVHSKGIDFRVGDIVTIERSKRTARTVSLLR